MSQVTARQSLDETLNVYEGMQRDAQMLLRSWAQMDADLRAQISELEARREILRERHQNAAANLVKYTGLIAETHKAIRRLTDPIPRAFSGKRPALSKENQIARLRLQIAALEAAS